MSPYSSGCLRRSQCRVCSTGGAVPAERREHRRTERLLVVVDEDDVVATTQLAHHPVQMGRRDAHHAVVGTSAGLRSGRRGTPRPARRRATCCCPRWRAPPARRGDAARAPAPRARSRSRRSRAVARAATVRRSPARSSSCAALCPFPRRQVQGRVSHGRCVPGRYPRLPYRVRRNGWRRDPPRQVRPVSTTCRLVAATDVDDRRAAEFADRFGMAAVDGVDGLLGVGVDAVYVCVPPFAHGEARGAAGRAGRGGDCSSRSPWPQTSETAEAIGAQLDPGRGAHPGGTPLALRRTGRPCP